MQTLLTFYLLINCLLTGWNLGQQIDFARTTSEKINLCLQTGLLLCFGLFWLVLTILIKIIDILFTKLQVYLLFNLFFTKKYNKIEENRLKELNKYFNKTKFEKFVLKIINKRNNYIHNNE